MRKAGEVRLAQPGAEKQGVTVSTNHREFLEKTNETLRGAQCHVQQENLDIRKSLSPSLKAG